MKTAGVLLAAGSSHRFGPGDKLLAPWKGATLVAAAAANLAAAGCDGLAAVVSSPAVAAALPRGFTVIEVPPGGAMSDSYLAAVAFAERAGASRMLIALGDMPSIRAQTYARLMQAAGTSRACRSGDTPMPPALLHRGDWRRLCGEGDFGARQIIRTLPPAALISLDQDEAIDIDLPGDLI